MYWSDVYARPSRPTTPGLVTGFDIRAHRAASSPSETPRQSSREARKSTASNCSRESRKPRVNRNIASRVPHPRAAMLSISDAAVKKFTSFVGENTRKVVIALASTAALAFVVYAGSGIAGMLAEQAEADMSSYVEQTEYVPYVKSHDAARLQFAQSGEPWSDLPYWDGTVSMNGCGLCSYTTAIDILTGSSYTPIDMLAIRGDWAGMDNYADDATGLDGMTHAEFTLGTFGIETKQIPVSMESLSKTASRGDSVAIVCAGGGDFLGTMGDEHFYPGHFVCVWDLDEDGNFHVHDSATSHGYGCNVTYTPEEMQDLLNGTTSIMSYRKTI